MIAKIKRGGGFRGALDYALNEGKKAVEGKEAELIGGNMSGTNSRELAEEFKASRELRPEVARPVWTESLRPAEGDKLTDEQWLDVAHSHMQQLGLDPDRHMHVIVKHDDHIHIVASRIAVDASLYHGKNENLIASKDCRRIEREYGLTRVKPDLAKSKSLTKNEVEMSKRTNAEPPRERIQRVVSEAVKTAPDMAQFRKALAAEGIEYKRSGFGVSYAADGVAFKASQLGTDFSAKVIENRIEQNRPEPVKSPVQPTPEPQKPVREAVRQPEPAKPKLVIDAAGAAERSAARKAEAEAADRQARADARKAMFAPKPKPVLEQKPVEPCQQVHRPDAPASPHGQGAAEAVYPVDQAFEPTHSQEQHLEVKNESENQHEIEQIIEQKIEPIVHEPAPVLEPEPPARTVKPVSPVDLVQQINDRQHELFGLINQIESQYRQALPDFEGRIKALELSKVESVTAERIAGKEAAAWAKYGEDRGWKQGQSFQRPTGLLNGKEKEAFDRWKADYDVKVAKATEATRSRMDVERTVSSKVQSIRQEQGAANSEIRRRVEADPRVVEAKAEIKRGMDRKEQIQRPERSRSRDRGGIDMEM